MMSLSNQHIKKTKNTRTTIEDIEAFKQSYSDLPCEAIIKQDILRLGLDFDPKSLEIETSSFGEQGDQVRGKFKSKDYFIFTFDHVPLEEQPQGIRFRMPEEIRISGGSFELLPTIISVRSSPGSPYRICKYEQRPALFLGNQFLAEVEYPPVPGYYQHTTSAGKSPGEIAPVIEWGYLIYLTVFRNCQYFGKDEECAFCDINHNYRQQKGQGRPYTGVKSLEEILEVLSWIDQEDQVAEAYTITGGSVTKVLRGKREEDFYFEYAEGIQKRFGSRWIGKIVTQAWEKQELHRFHDVGIQIYHPNYEVWDEKLFKLLCPGKSAFIGREQWVRRIIDAANVFGPSCVIPNFVAGVELSQPYGFASVGEAVHSTAEGLDFFMSHGVVPRFTTWCPEPFTTLVSLRQQSHPPLEYFLELLRVWKETFTKYRLPVPPGYGEAGAGRAVFSVSAFMDVIDPLTPKVAALK